MKTMQDWLDAYAVSHQNKTNKAIHFVCVPLIVFSVVGLFMSIPNEFLKQLSGISSDALANWAVVTLVPIMFFYLRLSVKMGVLILAFLSLCIYGNAQIASFIRFGKRPWPSLLWHGLANFMDTNSKDKSLLSLMI